VRPENSIFLAAGRAEECGVTSNPNPPLHRVPADLADGTAGPTTALQPAPPDPRNRTRAALWLQRFGVLMFVFLCAAMGVFLVILPWRPEWTDNYLLLAYPGLRAFVSNGFVRGVCSGLGVLDIWIGFWEAVHYHEEKQP
jgi:hypothetical protein